MFAVNNLVECLYFNRQQTGFIFCRAFDVDYQKEFYKLILSCCYFLPLGVIFLIDDVTMKISMYIALSLDAAMNFAKLIEQLSVFLYNQYYHLCLHTTAHDLVFLKCKLLVLRFYLLIKFYRPSKFTDRHV